MLKIDLDGVIYEIDHFDSVSGFLAHEQSTGKVVSDANILADLFATAHRIDYLQKAINPIDGFLSDLRDGAILEQDALQNIVQQENYVTKFKATSSLFFDFATGSLTGAKLLTDIVKLEGELVSHSAKRSLLFSLVDAKFNQAEQDFLEAFKIWPQLQQPGMLINAIQVEHATASALAASEQFLLRTNLIATSDITESQELWKDYKDFGLSVVKKFLPGFLSTEWALSSDAFKNMTAVADLAKKSLGILGSLEWGSERVVDVAQLINLLESVNTPVDNQILINQEVLDQILKEFNAREQGITNIVDSKLSILDDPIFTFASINPFGLSVPGNTSRPTFADIDGDGDLDGFVGIGGGDTLFFENIGQPNSPVFAPYSINPFGLVQQNGITNPTFVDIDNDGDLDAFLDANPLSSTKFFKNTGTANNPIFADFTTNPFGLRDLKKGTFVDIDGDGDLDAFGKRIDKTWFFENTGTANNPVFSPPTTDPFGLSAIEGGGANSYAFVDIDGDGDLDAFIGTHAGYTVFIRNAGTISNPVFADHSTDPFGLMDVGFNAKTTFVDIDDDGDLDAFIGNGSNTGETWFFVNDSNSSFSGNPPTGSVDNTHTLNGNDRLISADSGLALDLDGSAGEVAKLIGAVFGAESVSNASYVATGLYYLDNGTSYEDLAAGAITFADAKTPEQVTSLLWENVMGSTPAADDIQPYINMLNSGTSVGELSVFAADSLKNQANIDLVGLSDTGIIFDPLHYMPVKLPNIEKLQFTDKTSIDDNNTNPAPNLDKTIVPTNSKTGIIDSNPDGHVSSPIAKWRAEQKKSLSLESAEESMLPVTDDDNNSDPVPSFDLTSNLFL